MITVHHLNNSRSQRVLWLLEELEAAVSRAGLNASRPQLTAFLQRIHARPAYQRALERGGAYSF
jgi:glutathione S-transferase